MEFGIFIQGTCTGPRAHVPAEEHKALMDEAAYARTADQNNWKYCWVTAVSYTHLTLPTICSV